MAAAGIAASSAAAAAEFGLEAVLDAVRIVESGGHPWVVFDNTTGQSLESPDRGAAEALARQRLSQGHSLDLGEFQINSMQLRRPGLRIETVFEPAMQRGVAREILGEFLARARQRYGDTELAWRRAIGAYNCGRIDVDHPDYVARVLRHLGAVALPAAPVVAAEGARPAGAGPAFAAIGYGREAPAAAAASGDRAEEQSIAAGAAMLLIVSCVLVMLGGSAAIRWAVVGGLVATRIVRGAAAGSNPAGAIRAKSRPG